jgi:acetyl esterase/lipase
VFLVGDQDPWRKNAVAACDRLTEHGADAQLISLGDVGHWLPDNFDDLYAAALRRLEVAG